MHYVKTKPYNSVSSIYNGLMAKVDYNHWSNYILSIINVYADNHAKVLDLGAGNCIMAEHMREYFSNIVAADLSIGMLKSDPEIKINKVCCNMISLPFKTKFDLIYSTFDSVNYLLNKSQLKNLFSETARILSNGGIFTFDVCLEMNSHGYTAEQVSEGSYSSIRFRQVSRYNRLSRIHKNDFIIYYPDGNVVREIHKQKIFSFNTYLRLINESEFKILNCFEAFSKKAGSESSDRVQFVLQKKSD